MSIGGAIDAERENIFVAGRALKSFSARKCSPQCQLHQSLEKIR